SVVTSGLSARTRVQAHERLYRKRSLPRRGEKTTRSYTPRFAEPLLRRRCNETYGRVCPDWDLLQ
ncbi:hypothetical protein LTR16_010369, partial [Cryomyces antarcticus]